MNHDWRIATRNHRVDTNMVKPCAKEARAVKTLKRVWRQNSMNVWKHQSFTDPQNLSCQTQFQEMAIIVTLTYCCKHANHREFVD